MGRFIICATRSRRCPSAPSGPCSCSKSVADSVADWGFLISGLVTPARMGKQTKRTRKFLSKPSNKDVKKSRGGSKGRVARKKAHAFNDCDDSDVDIANVSNEPTAQPQTSGGNPDGGFAVEDMDVDEFLKGDFVLTDNENYEDEAARHAAELKLLQKTDPEFYAHLCSKDKGLLDFNADDELLKADDEMLNAHDEQDDSGAEDGGDVAEDEHDEDQGSLPKETSEITMDILRTLQERATVRHSVRSLKRLIRLFRVACHATDDDKDDSNDAESIRITDETVFASLVKFAFTQCPSLIARLLELPADQPTNVKQSSHWKYHESMIRSFIGNAIHFVLHAVDESMQQFGLRSLESALPLMVPFPKLCQRYLKTLLHIWSHAPDQVRIDAFLQLRQLTLLQASRPSFLDAVLKGIYLTFVRNAKFLTAQNAPLLRFMMNCIVELYMIDPVASYQHAFVYLRQIAIHIRGSTDVNAQLLTSLRVWNLVLCAHCKGDAGQDSQAPMRALIYPFTQIAMAMIGAHASVKYYPLHLQCATMLHELQVASGVYIPLSPVLLPIMTSSHWAMPTGKAITKPPSIDTMIAAPASVLKTKSFQESVLKRSVDLLRAHMTSLSRSIAFPELAFPVRRALSKFVSGAKIARFRKAVQKLMTQISSNATWIESKRSDVDFAPKSRDAVAAFSSALPRTPLEVYSDAHPVSDASDDVVAPTSPVDGPVSDDDDVHESDNGSDEAEDEDTGNQDPNAEDVIDDLSLSDSDE